MPPQYVWVGPKKVDDRIDTRPYKPWVLERTGKCSEFPSGAMRLGDRGVCDQITRGVGGGKPEAQPVAVYKAKEVTGYGFSPPELYVTECPSSKLLKNGDVVLTSSGIGTIGRAELVDNTVTETACTVDNHVAVIRLSTPSPLLPEFLLSFLNCRFGKAWSEWGTTGSTRLLELSTAKVRRFEVPKADPRVQEFVAAKVRLACQCRATARRSLRLAQDRLETLLAAQRFKPSQSLCNTVDLANVSNRLDAGFYMRRQFDLLAHLSTLTFPVCEIGTLLRANITRTATPERAADGAIPCVLTSDIDPQEIRWRQPSLRISEAVHLAHSGRLEPLDVVYTSVGPPVGEAAVVLPEMLPLAMGGDVSVLRHGPSLHPGYLSLYLNSVFGQMQNERYSRGIRQRRVYPEDIASFAIPRLPSDEQAFIGDRVVSYQTLENWAVDMTNQAMLDVERLIEGTLDVDGIIAKRLKSPRPPKCLELAETRS